MRVETVMLGPDTEQYAGEGVKKASLADIGRSAGRLEELGFDGLTAPSNVKRPPFDGLAASSNVKRPSFDGLTPRPTVKP